MSVTNLTGEAITGTNFNKMVAVVVDPVDNMRGSIANMVMEIGFTKVYQAKNGLDVLQLMSRMKVDLIISEWEMPKMDGITLLKKVRAQTKTAYLPFIMVSATVEHSEVLHAVKMGVSEYVVKPFSPKILEERITRAITNPVKKSATQVTESKAKSANERGVRILVVDDVPDNIQIISQLLKPEYQIKAATSGKKAIEICQSANPPDLLLLDIMMPEMDGIAVCKALKSNPLTQHIQIIFLTALDQTEDIVKGLELGAVDYIVKPVNPPVLKARVKTHAKLVDANRNMRNQIDTLIENARLKEEFDRVIQNDLKSPLREMSKDIEVLLRQCRDPARVKQNGERLRHGCQHIEQMVDNMLLLNKLEDGSYDFTPIPLDLQKTVQTVIEAFKHKAMHKRLEINLDVAIRALVYAEELLMHSILNNLLENAIDAAPRGSAILIKMVREDSDLMLTIHNGGAIPQEIRSNFFGKYVTFGKRNGSGIGTYAVKLMMEIQKGKVAFDSDDEHGTHVHLFLPAAC